MGLSDQDKTTIAREYFIRADQGRPDVLELFHEDAEIYFPKFGFGFGRQSFFEILQVTISWLKGPQKVRCPVSPGLVAKLPADAFATCSNSEMAG
jgi:hypothetical protein